METISETATLQTVDESLVFHPDRDKSSHGISGFFPAMVNMIAEDGGNFFRYIKELGLSREKNIVVLSSRHHYFYDENEMKNVSTLINLRKLNSIKALDEFILSLVKIMPTDSRFVGCFDDSGKGNSFNHPFRLIRKTINLLGSAGDHILTKDKVNAILESYGFRVSDLTEIDGKTYFCAANAGKRSKLRA
ncbi:MAG: hypothetical protein RBT38_10795 [Bacteroidales bacterium]|jgi:hypothetical protein|nr:hypothetical protein [Bacteroidales bacterium]